MIVQLNLGWLIPTTFFFPVLFCIVGVLWLWCFIVGGSGIISRRLIRSAGFALTPAGLAFAFAFAFAFGCGFGFSTTMSEHFTQNRVRVRLLLHDLLLHGHLLLRHSL